MMAPHPRFAHLLPASGEKDLDGPDLHLLDVPRPAKRGEGGPDAERSEAEGPGEGQ